MAWTDRIALRRGTFNDGRAVAVLILCFLILLCISMVVVSRDVAPSFNLRFDDRNLAFAALAVAALSCCAPLLASARGIFGFAAAFYLLAVTAGYLWLSYFTPLQYDHTTARLSAVASWVAFAIPTLLITKPLPISTSLTIEHFNQVCVALLFLSAGVAALGYSLGFHFVGVIEGESLRATLNFPRWMRYAISISATAALPLCFAWFVKQKQYVLSVIALVISVSYYPITLNKTTLLTPFWLIFIAALLKLTSCRTAVVLSLFVPTLLGLGSLALNHSSPTDWLFRVVNFRMLAIPASAMDHYNHFFSNHPLTNFCQISIIGQLFNCALTDQLGTMMAHEYSLGNYNGSLLATEGIASVGPYFAPLSALLCGILIAGGNVASARLDPSFVFLSAAVILQTLMNVPLSTILLTHGGALLALLWLLTPRNSADFDD